MSSRASWTRETEYSIVFMQKETVLRILLGLQIMNYFSFSSRIMFWRPRRRACRVVDFKFNSYLGGLLTSTFPSHHPDVDREVRTRVIKRETRTIERTISPGSFSHSVSEGPGETTTTYTRTLSGGPESGETVRKERRSRRFLDEGKY